MKVIQVQHPYFNEYEIAIDGYIWSKPKNGRGGHNGQWIKPMLLPNGYLKITLCKNKKRYQRYIHRLVLETYCGSCPKKMECRHIDGNKTNNTIDNLYWGTIIDNANDKRNHGTMRCGNNHEWSKLTHDDIIKIIELRKIGLTHEKISNFYNVRRETITKILNGKRWKHVIR